MKDKIKTASKVEKKNAMKEEKKTVKKDVKKDKSTYQTGGQTSLAPFLAEDIYDFKLIDKVHISPGMNEAVFEVKYLDKSSDEDVSKIWIKSFTDDNSATEKQFTFGAKTDKFPLWSPDGNEVAFLSNRAESSFQIYIMNRDGGEARKLTSLRGGVTSFEWFPDAKKILAISTVDIEEKPKDISEEQWKKRPQITNSIRYKNDAAGILTDSHTHIFQVDVESGQTTQLTQGDYDVLDLSISPDGKEIAYCRSRAGKEHITDLWIMKPQTNHFEQITNDIVSTATPNWSPDGKWIVVYGAKVEGRSISWPWLINPVTKENFELGDGLAEIATFPLHKPSRPTWDNDSKKFYCLVSTRGLSVVTEIDIESKKMKTIVSGQRHICNFHKKGKLIAFISQSVSDPLELYTYDLETQSESKVTALNQSWWSEKDIPVLKKVKFKVEEDKIIEGWIIEGNGIKKPAPLLVDVHGGPHSMAEFGFPYHPYWYILASKGWSILALNQEGSGSYGLEFAESLRGEWGERDFPQILKAISTLQEENAADDRVVIAGKSYGGFMSAWAIGHSKIFKAAIVSAPVSNLESHTSTSDSGYYVGPFDMKSDLNTDRELFRKYSPVTYCKRIDTPTLVLQGEKDERCPKGQAEEFFSGIKQNNCPAQLVLYPEGHHDLAEAGRPSHRIDYHKRIADWCEKWT